MSLVYPFRVLDTKIDKFRKRFVDFIFYSAAGGFFLG